MRKPKGWSKGTLPIRSVDDIQEGDILCSPNDYPVVYFVADIKKRKAESFRKKIFFFTIITSGIGKVYDIPESFIALLGMRKVKVDDSKTKTDGRDGIDPNNPS